MSPNLLAVDIKYYTIISRSSSVFDEYWCLWPQQWDQPVVQGDYTEEKESIFHNLDLKGSSRD